MKIRNISIYAFKGIESETIPVGECNLLLMGPNGVGKSSILDAIYAVLSPDSMPQQPINIKHDKAKVGLELVDDDGKVITATLNINEKGHNLTLKMGEFSIDKPRTYLNKIVGENIDFDPIKFADNSKTAAGKREQAKTILKILGLDFTEIEEAIKDYKEQRLESTRKLEALKTKKKVLAEKLPDGIEQYSEPKVITKLLEEKTLLEADVNKNRAARLKADSLREKTEETEKAIAELQKKLETLKAEHAQQIQIINSTQSIVEKVLDIETQIAGSETHNKLHKQYSEFKEVDESLAIEETTNKNLDLAVKDQNKKKLELISERSKSLELGFDLFIDEEANIYVDRVLMQQLNTAKQIEVGIKIYMHSNPKLRILRLSNLSLCDKATKQHIQDLINANDYQAFVEVVEPDGEELTIDIQEHLNLQ